MLDKKLEFDPVSIPQIKSLPPGFLPILTLRQETEFPLTEAIAILLDADLTHFLVQTDEGGEASELLLKDLMGLREHMNFDVVLPLTTSEDLLSQSVGVHLPMDQEEIRRGHALLGETQRLVCWANSFEEAELAEKNGADAVILGPIFGEDALGIEELSDACRLLSVPVFASGGIDAGSLLQIKDAGAYGFCVPEISHNSEDFEHEVMKLTSLWNDFSEQS